MRTTNNSRRNAKTIHEIQNLLRTVRLTIDLSAPGVVIPVCPTDGTITLDFTILSETLRATKTEFTAVYNFDGESCGISVPFAAILDVESVPASREVAERALQLVAQC